MTVLLWADYLKDLQLRTEKESLLNTINYTLSYVKSTNYYQGDRFAYIDVELSSTWVAVTLDSWTWFGNQLALMRSTLILSGTSDTIRLSPYVRACEDVVNAEDVVSFSLQSNVNDNEFCFDRDMRLCKLFVVSCP